MVKAVNVLLDELKILKPRCVPLIVRWHGLILPVDRDAATTRLAVQGRCCRGWQISIRHRSGTTSQIRRVSHIQDRATMRIRLGPKGLNGRYSNQ